MNNSFRKNKLALFGVDKLLHMDPLIDAPLTAKESLKWAFRYNLLGKGPYSRYAEYTLDEPIFAFLEPRQTTPGSKVYTDHLGGCLVCAGVQTNGRERYAFMSHHIPGSQENQLKGLNLIKSKGDPNGEFLGTVYVVRGPWCFDESPIRKGYQADVKLLFEGAKEIFPDSNVVLKSYDYQHRYAKVELALLRDGHELEISSDRILSTTRCP